MYTHDQCKDGLVHYVLEAVSRCVLRRGDIRLRHCEWIYLLDLAYKSQQVFVIITMVERAVMAIVYVVVRGGNPTTMSL